MLTLTKRQTEIYHYLKKHLQEYDHAPSIEEICVAMGVTSRGSMHKHLQALIKAGLIESFNGLKRGIKLITPVSGVDLDIRTLPLLGKIAAGVPFEAIENPDVIAVPEQLCTKGECFVLIVKGESMIDAGIHDGDWVVIEKTVKVKNGDIVAALIDNYEATLKRIEKTQDLVILHPENASMKAMIFSPQRVTIQGKLVGQMRSYR